MAPKKIIDQLVAFRKKVQKEIPITKMYLFGSMAWGSPHKDSDIDLIVVSPTFRKKKSFKRSIGLYKRWQLDYPVDFLCYTPEEFKKLSQQITIVRKAVKEGIEIRC
jgi:predicted nucleotidyltransferase